MTSKIIKSSYQSASLFWFLIFTAIFSLQVLPRLAQDAPVGDENIDIVDGFYYWAGDVISAAEHPPLAKSLQALPSRFMGLQSKSGLNFSQYDVRDAYFLTVLNKDRFADILASARLMTVIFGLGLGLLLFGWARQESLPFLLTVMVLWAFEPALLAFSGFALADIPLTFFFFAAVLAHQKLIRKPSVKRAVMVGLLSGMAVTVKFTALLLVPIFLILEWFNWIESKRKPARGAIAQRWFCGGGAALAWICLVYLPGTLAISGHPEPLGLFLNGFKSISHSIGASYYFQGILSPQSHWDYYPTAFLLKSPLSFLILLSLGLFLVLLKKIQWPVWQWVPSVVFFAAFLFNHDMGLRLILPIYPFCILMAGRAGEWMVKTNRILLWVWGGLLLLQALSVGLRYPNQVSYFNEMVAPERRLYWLGDSNLDFGQDTQRLAEAVKAKGWDHVKLAYFGPINPGFYGMKWNYWTQKDMQGPQPGWVYLINDEMIQLGPAFLTAAPDILKSWITQVKPAGQIADTWYYFEIPGKIQSDKSPKILSAPIFVDDPKAFQKK
jgi:hypothetical protein